MMLNRPVSIAFRVPHAKTAAAQRATRMPVPMSRFFSDHQAVNETERTRTRIIDDFTRKAAVPRRMHAAAIDPDLDPRSSANSDETTNSDANDHRNKIS